MKAAPRKHGRKQKPKSEICISQQVKRAINRFIKRTERIVQTVSPDASIIVHKSSRKSRKSPQSSDDIEPKPTTDLPVELPPVDPKKWVSAERIPIPQFRDDGVYERSHQYRESVEGLLRSRHELQRIKGNRRSTYGVHKDKLTQENLQKNLAVLAMFVEPETVDEYKVEGTDLLQWPSCEQQNTLLVRMQGGNL